jgi:hypothetical protein
VSAVYTVVWTAAAVKDLTSLTVEFAIRVLTNIPALARDPRPEARTVAEIDKNTYVLTVAHGLDVVDHVTGLAVVIVRIVRRP